MSNDMQRKTVWEGWLSAEIRSYYFGEMATEAHRRQRVVTFSTLLISSGAATTLLTGLPAALAWLPTILVLLTTALSLYAVVARLHDRAATSADLHMGWSRLGRRYEALWHEMQAGDAAVNLAPLAEEEDMLSKQSMSLGRPNNRQLVKWEDYVVERHGPHAVGASA